MSHHHHASDKTYQATCMVYYCVAMYLILYRKVFGIATAHLSFYAYKLDYVINRELSMTPVMSTSETFLLFVANSCY